MQTIASPYAMSFFEFLNINLKYTKVSTFLRHPVHSDLYREPVLKFYGISKEDADRENICIRYNFL